MENKALDLGIKLLKRRLSLIDSSFESSNKMRIVLLFPKYFSKYIPAGQNEDPYCFKHSLFATLLGYCGSYLEYEGHQAKLISYPQEKTDKAQVKLMIEEWCPNLIVLFTGIKNMDEDIIFAESIIRSVKCDSVFVGPYASSDPNKTLSRSKIIKKLITGEFEYAVEELARGVNLADIKNLIYTENETIKINPIREFLTSEQIDTIPFVSKFFIKQLEENLNKEQPKIPLRLDILTSRGSKYDQGTYYQKSQSYTTRCINNVIEEFKYIESELPYIRSVMIQDDVLTEKRSREFSELKIDHEIKLPWSCRVRPNMSYTAMKLMRKANCQNIYVDYSSCDPDILTHIKKSINIERMIRFTQDAKTAGLRTYASFGFGFPNETQASAIRTVEIACRMNTYRSEFQIVTPLPGTELHNKMKQNGWLNNHGEPNMPQFSNDQIREMIQYAYKRFYFSPRYFIKCLRNPYDYFLNKFEINSRSILELL